MIKQSWDKYPDPWRGPHTNPNKYDPPKSKIELPTIASLFPNLDRIAIGWDGILEDLLRATSVKAKPSYPPYDVIKLDGNIFIIHLAVAGFKRDELDVTIVGNKLSITGTHADEDSEGEVIHNGIAKRDFTLNFRLADGVVLESARLEDGILTIHLRKEVPESEKPKQIEIK